jgi:hypothetical protein
VKEDSPKTAWTTLFSAFFLALVGCGRNTAALPSEAGAFGSASGAAPALAASSSAKVPASASAVGGEDSRPVAPVDTAAFARLFGELSEPDRYFFSDNFVSNETSFLHVASLLERKAMPGGAYIGVGPEQNFSYIAISRPNLAFIIDIRRQNALEHLLYKAIFDEAESRSAFLCLLLGARCKTSEEPGPDAGVEVLLDRAEAAWKLRDKPAFRTLHERLKDRIEQSYRIALSKRDAETLEHVHRAFFNKGLAIAFELHSPENQRDYPSFRELMLATSADGQQRGFLANERDYRLIRRMQRDNRIIPVVGDFAGEHALRAIAAELRRRDLPISVFYTSNVEQYLVDPPKWQRWVENVEALPTNESSLFLRCYLDQGRRHPQQLKGHRTASVLQLFDHFRWKQRTRGYTGFWQLATDGVITE